MPEPMPCPHCNGAPKLLGPDEFGGDDIYHYVCWNEDCPTNWDSGERASTKERSLEQWNDQRGVKAAVDDVAETACTEMAKVKDAALQAVADAVKAERGRCAGLARAYQCRELAFEIDGRQAAIRKGANDE